MTGNASRAQYQPETVCSVDCLTPPPPHRMPETGYTVAWVLLAGLVLVAVGLWVRSWLDGRAT